MTLLRLTAFESSPNFEKMQNLRVVQMMSLIFETPIHFKFSRNLKSTVVKIMLEYTETQMLTVNLINSNLGKVFLD